MLMDLVGCPRWTPPGCLGLCCFCLRLQMLFFLHYEVGIKNTDKSVKRTWVYASIYWKEPLRMSAPQCVLWLPGSSLCPVAQILWDWIIYLIPVLLNISPQVVFRMRLMPLKISTAGIVQRKKHSMLKYFELKAIKKRSGLPSIFWKAHNIIIFYKDKSALSPLSARKDAGQSLQTTSDPYHSGNSTRGIYTKIYHLLAFPQFVAPNDPKSFYFVLALL